MTSPKLVLTMLAGVLALTLPFGALTDQEGEGRIVGRVTAHDTGAPLAAELGLALSVKGGVRLNHHRTSEQGEFTLENLPAGTVHLTTKLAGYAVEHQSLTLGADETRTVEFRLRQAASASGAIVDSSGHLIEGATVRVIYADDGAASLTASQQWEQGELKSDARGGFSLAVHPAKEFVVEAAHPDLLGAISAPLQGAAAGLTLSLRRGVSFAGQMLDDAGEPLRDVQVQLHDVEERPELRRFASFELLRQRTMFAQTGADGGFRFEQVAPARKELIVADPAHRPLKQSIEVREHTQSITLRLSRR